MRVDVAIIGGGIAGSSLALVLARRGVSVALVERERVFRDRVRGEAIHPWGVREIDRLGLRELVVHDAGGLELPIWQTYREREIQEPFAWTEIDPDSPPELSVRHPDLQSALIAAAASAGATVFRPSQANLDLSAAGPIVSVVQNARTTTVTARLIVGADGSRSLTRRWLGGFGTRDPIHHYIAGALVSGLDLDPRAAHHASGEGGFAMIFPQTGETSRVYLVCTREQRQAMSGASQPDAMMRAAAHYFPDGRITSWEAAGPAAFFPNSDIVSSITDGKAAVLIGDAAGANDPSLGHGLSLTFRDVRLLSDLLTSDEPWKKIPAIFGEERARYYGVLREHAKWVALLTAEVGPEADARRDRVALARELDPTAGGFASIFAFGPDGLVVDDATRRHFHGEDLESNPQGQ